MKLGQLLETLDYVPGLKLKKVKAFLTPALAAEHHELICQALAKFVPAKDIDVLRAAALDTNKDGETVKFILKLLAKQLAQIPAFGSTVKFEQHRGEECVSGTSESIKDKNGWDDFHKWFMVSYT